VYGTTSADSAPTAPVEQPGRIGGRVTTSNTKPIAGATVNCGSAGAATTNATGDYAITAVPPGNYTCNAGATGYAAKTLIVTVKAGITTTANFSLARSSTRVHAMWATFAGLGARAS
jgi:iron complex outermembrane receptor protein